MSKHPNRAAYGLAAVRAGDPDHTVSDAETSMVDTLANVMHYAASQGLDYESLQHRAEMHFAAEGADSSDLKQGPAPPIVLVVRHPDAENAITVYNGVGDVRVFDIDLGRSFDGTCDSTEQYDEWSQSMLTDWDLPRHGDAYDAFTSAIAQARP